MKKIVIISLVAIVALVAGYFVYQDMKEKAKIRGYAAAFPNKTWYYSSDGGKTWMDRAEGGLKGFDDDGTPIHVSEAWNHTEWQDENTILWRATNGNESIWKAFANPPF
ncbi:MAG: hypothetical protein ACKVQV_06430 [Bacteroidia bacterium]